MLTLTRLYVHEKYQYMCHVVKMLEETRILFFKIIRVKYFNS